MNRILVFLATRDSGSGKSTLIKYIVAALNLTPKQVAYIAYTGKASKVLQQKGCPNATTAHKLLYKVTPCDDGIYIFEPKDLPPEYKLLVVDEVSMLPRDMWDLLLSHGVHILASGDPEQLPPIDPDTDNHVLEHPHIFLDEIMRQAQDSEIIRLSMWVRQGKPLKRFPVRNEQVMFLDKQDVTPDVYNWADQILCATNKTRNEVNNIVRESLGFGQHPEVGDRIISEHNHWDFCANNVALTNGSIGIIDKMSVKNVYYPKWIKQGRVPLLTVNMEDEDGVYYENMPIDYNKLLTGESTFDIRQIMQIKKAKRSPPEPFEFAYAYAITCWKAQGSEWDKILLLEENFPFDYETHKKFLYTGITRASQKLVVVTK